jgi:copper chaperone CopZ
MKNKKTASLLLSFLIFAPPAFAEEITVTVKGMVCSFCAQGIKKTFSKNENVTDINVDLDNKLVKLKTKDGTTLEDGELREKITDAGYEVISIERGKGD